MTGDDLLPDCRSTGHGPSRSAPRQRLCGRGSRRWFSKTGFYSNDLLDNLAHPSAHEVLPQHQRLNIGDWIPMFSKVNEKTAFKIKVVEPNRALLWAKPDSTWAWKLTPLPGEGTRLVTRLRETGALRPPP